jgi:hypothetical protein
VFYEDDEPPATEEFGDTPGHPFRGNQYSGGTAGFPPEVGDFAAEWATYQEQASAARAARRDVGTPGAQTQEEYDAEQRMNALHHELVQRYGEETVGAAIMRAQQDLAVNAAVAEYAAAAGMTEDEYRAELKRHLTELVAGKDVVVRVTPSVLEHVLDDGRLKTQYESGRSGGYRETNLDNRRMGELATTGTSLDTPDAERPVYGSVAVSGLRGAGRDDFFDGNKVNPDRLSQYGRVQVVLKPSVRGRTTFTVGDSLDTRYTGRASRLTDPSIASAGLVASGRGGLVHTGLRGDPLGRDYESPQFRGNQYVEAQIHGGVRVDDIAEVVLPSRAGKLVSRLDAAGIPWRVVKPTRASLAAVVVELGDKPGHPFRGNQYSGSEGVPEVVDAATVDTGYGSPTQEAIDERLKAARDVGSGWVDGYYRGPSDEILAAHNLTRDEYDALWASGSPNSGDPKLSPDEQIVAMEAAREQINAVMTDLYARNGEEWHGVGEAVPWNAKRPSELEGWVQDDGALSVEALNRSRAELGALVRDGEISVRLPAGKLDDVVAAGRLMNQAEVGKMHWSTGRDPDSPGDRTPGYATARRAAEQDFFGVPKGTKRADRPIYGFVSGGPENELWTKMYGNAELVLRPSVKNRASVTSGDSLDDKLIPARWHDVASGNFDPRLNMRSVESDPTRERYTPRGGMAWTQDVLSPRYNEVQVRGGVSLADVDHVVLHGGTTISPDVAAALQRAGVNVVQSHP